MCVAKQKNEAKKSFWKEAINVAWSGSVLRVARPEGGAYIPQWAFDCPTN